MSELDKIRKTLLERREERARASRLTANTREEAARAHARAGRVERGADPKSDAGRERVEAAAAARNRSKEAYQEQLRESRRAAALELAALEAFVRATDPTKSLPGWERDKPLLLLPVRLETRFIRKGDFGNVDLCVRVFPDEALIDTFESDLTESEVKNTRQFWIDWWRAGGKEAQRRAAWRQLASSHGAGRAAWVVQNLSPENPEAEPTKNADNDLILVIANEQPLDDQAWQDARDYWIAVWRKPDDAAALTAASDALDTAVGAQMAARIRAEYAPTNMRELPPTGKTRQTAVVSTAFLQIAAAPAEPTRLRAWSRAPLARLLPDRFVLMRYLDGEPLDPILGNAIPSPLVCGPDPSLSEQDQLRALDGDLAFPGDMRWMVDFETAVAQGMGFRVPITESQARRGYDEVLVLGVRLSADAAAGASLISEWLQQQRNSGAGIAVLRQGTPTNNTEGMAAGFSRWDDADAQYDHLWGTTAVPQVPVTSDELTKGDGQWLAEWLGVEFEPLASVIGSNGTDQREARAMNLALWPATLGYFLESWLHPAVAKDDVAYARWFFTQYVSGRGPIPALRIHRQPYGIVPATAYSRAIPKNPKQLAKAPAIPDTGYAEFVARMDRLLQNLDAQWSTFAADVPAVGKAGDPHQILLDVLGLHPASVEFYQRYAQSLEHLFNVVNLDGSGGMFASLLREKRTGDDGLELLRRLGYDGEATPEAVTKFFLKRHALLKGPVIDDRPLSESEALRDYTDDGRNYIEWLIDAARASLDTVRGQQGFSGDQEPLALLYLYLRHAVMLGYWRASLGLHESAEVFTPSEALALHREAPFVHVKSDAQSESRWGLLYKQDVRVTGSPQQRVVDFITAQLGQVPETRSLDEQIRALEVLAQVPTARLERLFAEHMDCCSYRLDAWRLGIAHAQLARLRFSAVNGEQQVTKGIYVGAYGWLHDVRSEQKALEPVTLPEKLKPVFDRPQDGPLQKDATNAGYIIAPSLNHAVTAAILRNGYISNAVPENPSALAVDLSSQRVRLAMLFLEGMRTGQSLGALLGYQLERQLHDRHGTLELDRFIYALRKEFPLRANKLTPTAEPDPSVPIENLEARNVVDGLSLLEHIERSGARTYPFGKSLPSATTAEAAAVTQEARALFEIHDAIADVGIAESVHQAAQGNFDRAAGMLDTFGRGHFPPEPEVVRTPRSGRALTHRVAVQFDPTVSALASPVGGILMTARALAEPVINAWLAQVLPDPTVVACSVQYIDPATSASTDAVLTQEQLVLQPMDLLDVLHLDSEQAMSELDDRVLRWVHTNVAPRPDTAIRITHAQRIPGKITFFELAAMLRPLRALVRGSRALEPTDVALTNEASREQKTATLSLDKTRVERVQTLLVQLLADLQPRLNELSGWVDDLPAHRADVLDNLDAVVTGTVALLERASRFAIPDVGWGALYAWKREQFGAVYSLLQARIERWDAKLQAFDDALDEHNAPGATEEQRIAALRKAELAVSMQVITAPDAAALLPLVTARRNTFAQKRQAFVDILRAHELSLRSLLQSVQAELPISDFDREPLTVDDIEQAMLKFAGELRNRLVALRNAIQARLDSVTRSFQAHDTAVGAKARIEHLQAAAGQLCGEGFKLVPAFTLATEQAEEWELALRDGADGTLLRHASTVHDLPVDDWLYGAARVREKLAHWERLLTLCGAFGRTEPELVPMQLPHRPNDYWAALELPQTPTPYELAGDLLLYTASYARPFNRNEAQCGLLIDEWTEVIPSRTETAGVSFHFDRPDCEAPQAFMLVTPPAGAESWQWLDIVDAVRETFDLAKKRAVEPRQLDVTTLAQFLPATVMPAALYQISLATTLAANNRVYEAVKKNG